MSNIFVFHGVEGTPQENWFPWLKVELEKLGQNVFVPQFPTPQGQELEQWLSAFEQYKDLVNPDTIFVGHSLGGLFMLSLLEKFQVKASFFAASFPGLPGNEFDDGMRSFAKEFDWPRICQNSPQNFVFQGSDDPYVSLETANKLAESLNTEPRVIQNGGHFNGSAGYTQFPILLEEIKKVL